MSGAVRGAARQMSGAARGAARHRRGAGAALKLVVGLMTVQAFTWATAIAGTSSAAPRSAIPAKSTRAAAAKPATPAEPGEPTASVALDYAPYHGSLENIAWGGHGELRFGYDLTAGVSDPSWFSVGRANGFVLARLGSRLRLGGQAAYDRAADDFVLERAELIARMGRALDAHAGIFLAPLGRTNLDHDAPQYEFAERSLVATQLIGVPNAELGAGVRGIGSLSPAFPFTYELDLVTGFDDGIVMDAAGGTRLPAGRNNYGDQNGVPALAGRIALQPSVDTEIGFAAQSGPYNQTKVNGATVDQSRFVHLVVVDGETRAAGFQLSAEVGAALIDVPPALEALYAQKQWGASVEATRALRAPVFRAWHGTSLSAGIRADMVDFDMSVRGDSRSRLSASLNLRPHPYAVLRFGWYYEVRRDRFNNDTPMGGLTLTAASYF